MRAHGRERMEASAQKGTREGERAEASARGQARGGERAEASVRRRVSGSQRAKERAWVHRGSERVQASVWKQPSTGVRGETPRTPLRPARSLWCRRDWGGERASPTPSHHSGLDLLERGSVSQSQNIVVAVRAVDAVEMMIETTDTLLVRLAFSSATSWMIRLL